MYTLGLKMGRQFQGTVETPTLQISVLFTYLTSIPPWLAQRGSDNQGLLYFQQCAFLLSPIVNQQHQFSKRKLPKWHKVLGMLNSSRQTATHAAKLPSMCTQAKSAVHIRSPITCTY